MCSSPSYSEIIQPACFFILLPPSLSTDLYNNTASKAAMHPADVVVSQLFPHQREALAWMVARENSSSLPPFWVATQTPSGLLYTNRWVCGGCGGGSRAKGGVLCGVDV